MPAPEEYSAPANSEGSYDTPLYLAGEYATFENSEGAKRLRT